MIFLQKKGQTALFACACLIPCSFDSYRPKLAHGKKYLTFLLLHNRFLYKKPYNATWSNIPWLFSLIDHNCRNHRKMVPSGISVKQKNVCNIRFQYNVDYTVSLSVLSDNDNGLGLRSPDIYIINKVMQERIYIYI